MIGASAAPIRFASSGAIMPPSISEKRGSFTPETMYCQRYARRMPSFRRAFSSVDFDEGRPVTGRGIGDANPVGSLAEADLLLHQDPKESWRSLSTQTAKRP